MFGCNISGMLSIGVVPPDRKFIMMKIGSARSPNCGIEPTNVAIRIPSEVTEKRYITTPAKSAAEPAIGTRSSHLTTNSSDNIAGGDDNKPVRPSLGQHDLGWPERHC